MARIRIGYLGVDNVAQSLLGLMHRYINTWDQSDMMRDLGGALKRIARRASFGLARTGSSGGHGSGDFVIAFSTERDAAAQMEDLRLQPSFQATIEATEEAILNSMLRATSMDGHQGSRADALPIGRLREILKQYGR